MFPSDRPQDPLTARRASTGAGGSPHRAPCPRPWPRTSPKGKWPRWPWSREKSGSQDPAFSPWMPSPPGPASRAGPRKSRCGRRSGLACSPLRSAACRPIGARRTGSQSFPANGSRGFGSGRRKGVKIRKARIGLNILLLDHQMEAARRGRQSRPRGIETGEAGLAAVRPHLRARFEVTPLPKICTATAHIRRQFERTCGEGRNTPKSRNRQLAAFFACTKQPECPGAARRIARTWRVKHLPEPEKIEPALLSVRDAAKIIGVSTGTLRRMRARGDLTGGKLLGTLMLPREEVDRVLALVRAGVDVVGPERE